MKQTEQVSIGNRVFVLEVDAYEAVKEYLKKLQDYYMNMENGSEVMDGIEERMAELLQERVSEGSAVTKAQVLEVMGILGQPEEIEADRDGGSSSRPADGGRVRKRLYRDIENKFIGGVASGLSAFTGLDVVLYRMIFVLLTVLPLFLDKDIVVYMPLLYAIAWICIPAAKTVTQKCQMHGEASSVSGIYERMCSETPSDQPVSRRRGSGVGRVIQCLAGILLILIGLPGIIAGVASAVVCCTSIFPLEIEPFVISSLPTLASAFIPAVIILALLVAFIPFVTMFYAGVMMTFDFKSPKWRPGLCLFFFWVICIIALVVVAIIGGVGAFNLAGFRHWV